MSIKENLELIKSELPKDVTLIAVTKTRTVDEMRVAYDDGVRDFGENKVQEMIQKYDSFPSDVKWHIIGNLQRNKVKYIVDKVYLIHSLDSIKLLEEIEKQYSKIDKVAQVLVEINIGRENTKAGIFQEDLDELLQAVEKCSFVKVKGLMAIIPKGDEESSRNYFKTMKAIWEDLKKQNYNNISMEYLSMGMSNDYIYALKEGANMIRIGEGIFGKRIYNNNVK